MEQHYRTLCADHVVETVGSDEAHRELSVEQCQLMLDAVIPLSYLLSICGSSADHRVIIE